ncbi:CubicO group peptidase (beta-lactamase class C family) [Flavobacterium sp. 90]|uniref:serine hydrolase domain-containing protein n=1 Tax=unclassified Flavobacterium TaxID=196869 RepID=UPI000EB1B005|nr:MULTISPECIES: serine hydrolase [unclassified Flavobacterium]RKR04739.1 CubicO group peptidase (beta-lactamase class C family) [Flavobacterium sp. 81]TCK56061.1 CubicO group peptidase (beta-lactamase class C family) [Flavobacterium sp. 90]
MRKTHLLLLLLLSAFYGYSQQKFKITYEQLKEYEGVYEYKNNTTLQIAASPKDTILYAIINDSKYALKPSDKDVFLNMSQETVTFLRDKSSVINGYSSDEKTFKLLNKKVVFPKEMWYPRLNVTKDYKYVYQQPKKDLDGLVTGTLDNTGLDKALLGEMMQKIVDGTYANVHSVLIIKDGKLVFEEYFYDNNKAKLHELRSATKSFVSALTGIAIDKGLIKDKTETVLSYFPDYTIKNLTDDKKQITIENLLTNQSGLDCDVSNPKAEGNETAMNYSDDWIQFTLDLPMVDVPGGKGMYCSGNPITMGKIIERATKMPLPEFAKQTLFKDLGIKNFKWNFKPDASSAETFCQVYLTSRDMAKFGLLYLNKGLWNGKQVVSKNWVEQSLSKHSVVQGVNYGYLWWLKSLTANGIKYNGKAAQGNGGQKIYIWEDQNMITIITGGNYNSQSPSDELIQKYILPSFNVKKAAN